MGGLCRAERMRSAYEQAERIKMKEQQAGVHCNADGREEETE